jgi:hypothetical protein
MFGESPKEDSFSISKIKVFYRLLLSLPSINDEVFILYL